MLTVVLVLASAGSSVAFSQSQDQYAIQRAQMAVRDKILRERGSNLEVSFPEWAQTQTNYISNSQISVRGHGMYSPRDNYTRAQRFSFEAVVNISNGKVERLEYGNVIENGSAVERDRNYRDNRWNRAPQWLIGTFQGKDPVSRNKMTIWINRRGDASATYNNGVTQFGEYLNGQIILGPTVSLEVTQSGKDIRLKDYRTGRSEKFKRTSDAPGDRGPVPDWAVGTFRANTDSGESELSIGADGAATIRSFRTNRVFTGRYENGILTFEFGSFNLTRDGDTIRMTSQASYRRLF
jgi:hypothetical protein